MTIRYDYKIIFTFLSQNDGARLTQSKQGLWCLDLKAELKLQDASPWFRN